jgi:hypothetical protein
VNACRPRSAVQFQLLRQLPQSRSPYFPDGVSRSDDIDPAVKAMDLQYPKKPKLVDDPLQDMMCDSPSRNSQSNHNTDSGLSKNPPGSSVPDEAHVSDQHHPLKAGRTFRVHGVPLEWEKDDLQVFLAKWDTTAVPTVRSLAKEIDGGSGTATVIFQNAPRQPQPGRAWQIPLPASNQSTRPQTLTLDDGFLGITTLHAPPLRNHKVDIIAISGLGGHAFGSFKERGGNHMWLRDDLPYEATGGEDKTPLARVMVYGYESSLPQSNSVQNIEDLGTSFHTSLLALASAATLRPIIFVAHSLGGLILKQVGPLNRSIIQHSHWGARLSYHYQSPRGGMTGNSFGRCMESSFSASHMTVWTSSHSSQWWRTARTDSSLSL